jgi:heptosyltransferase-2
VVLANAFHSSIFLHLIYFTQFRRVKILVIQTAFIGDVILATGVLETLHQAHPEAQLDLLVRKGNEALLTGNPFLHQLLIWEKKKDKIKNLFLLLQQIRSARYDIIINLHRFASSGILTAFSNAAITIGYQKNPLSFLFQKAYPHEIGKKGETYLHETDRNHSLLESLSQLKKINPRLYPSPDDVAAIQSLQTTPYICLAPASVWYTKQWPPAKWVELIQSIPTTYSVFLLGAPGDQELCNGIIKSAGNDKAISLAGQLSFLQSAALMQGAVMNYVNDSAPLHMATATGAPVTAIFCSTIPEFGFGPLGKEARVVETKENLSCRPCGLHGHKKCPEGHFRCATTIAINDVLLSLTHSH